VAIVIDAELLLNNDVEVKLKAVHETRHND
jgi:hypothetical protein